MKKLALLILSLILVLSFISCADKTDDTAAVNEDNTPEDIKKISMKLYFANSDNSALPYEERIVNVKISDKDKQDTLKAALNELIQGPKNEELNPAIPENTNLIDVNLDDGTAIVNFSKEYNNFNGSIEEVIARTSVVNTLTEFKEIDNVKILVEGKDLIGPNGKPFGILNRVELDDKGYPINKKSITVYFGNSNADKVVAETREIILGEKSIEEAIFEELKKGPIKDDLHPIIPDGSELLWAKTEDGICTLNLSEEFSKNHNGGTAGDLMLINSIVNSYTELPNIDMVQFLIEDEIKEVFSHLVFDEPFKRDENMISK